MHPAAQIDSLIHTIRGQKVLLDRDLAQLYGVTTKVFNQASNVTKPGFLRILGFS